MSVELVVRQRHLRLIARQLTEEDARAYIFQYVPLPWGVTFSSCSYTGRKFKSFFAKVGGSYIEIGDWMLRDESGNILVVKTEIFKQNYEVLFD